LFNRISIGLVILLVQGACAPTAPVHLEPATNVAAPVGQVNAYLIRGFQDWYSTGIEALTKELTDAGISSQDFAEAQWRDVGDTLCRTRSGNDAQPLVLIGFSYGADDVVAIARRLNEHHLAVDLLITIDPVTPDAVPANVRRCVNFFQSNGVWDALPWLRGIPLHREGAANDGRPPLENIDVRHRPDLLEANTNHATIAANEKVHRAIIVLVTQLVPPHE
jgi:hypothetical protein